MIDSSLIEPDSSRQRYNRWRQTSSDIGGAAAGTDVGDVGDGDAVGSCNLRANRKLSASATGQVPSEDTCVRRQPELSRSSSVLGEQRDAAGTRADVPVCRYGDQPDQMKNEISESKDRRVSCYLTLHS